MLSPTGLPVCAGDLKLRDLMGCLRECLHAEPHMSYHLWVLMFPIVWGTMEKNQQVRARVCCTCVRVCV